MAHDNDNEVRESVAEGVGMVSEGEPGAKSEGIQVNVEDIGRGELPVCVLCASGDHDAAFEILHIMQCGCPCHEPRANAVQAGS